MKHSKQPYLRPNLYLLLICLFLKWQMWHGNIIILKTFQSLMQCY